MIDTTPGDLLKSDCNVLIHQANSFSKMGAGIALHIKKLYPEVYLSDKNDPRKPVERLGHYSYAYIERDNRFVFNLYGQYRYASFSRVPLTEYPAFARGLGEILTDLDRLWNAHGCAGKPKIGLPWGIGCGLAGGDWNHVFELLCEASDTHGYDLHLYKL